MKKKFFYLVSAVAFLSLNCSCSEDDNDPVEEMTMASDEEMDIVIGAYVDKVVLPTYADLKDKATALYEAVEAFATSKTQADLDNACDAWRATREPWEKSEAFLFGPADYAGLDPSLDSWPLDKNGLDQVLGDNSYFSNITGDSEEAQSLRGFHTIEYLLFLDGQNRTVASFESLGENAALYLQMVTKLLLNDAESLYKAWAEGLGIDEVPVAFGDEFKSHSTSRFGSAAVVVSSIIDGCMVIASEVGDAKIGEPHSLFVSGQKEEGLYAVESWYSWNSLADYTNNIISIENSYMGGIEGNRDEKSSLSALVAKYDPELDVELKERIKAAKTAINAIPAPFRNSLGNTAKVSAAMDACSSLESSLQKIKAALGID